MCMLSVVTEYGRDRIPSWQWTPDTFGQYQEILRKLEDLDKKLGEPDCEDPEKTEWMQEVEERLRRLEHPELENRLV